MSNPCEGNVDLANLEDRQRRLLAWVFAINVATFAMMVAGSVLSGSSALLSGTLDNLGDALTYALSLAVVGASARAKARVALLKGLLILAAALAVAAQIAWRLTELQAPIASTMSAAAALNLVANAVTLWGVSLLLRTGSGWHWIVIGGVATAACMAALALPDRSGDPGE